MSVYMTEEEQIQIIKNWWKRYSQSILISISVILLIIAGYRYWSWHKEKVAVLASNTYERLMLAVSHNDTQAIFARANQLIHAYPKTVYADIAHLALAKSYVANEQYKLAENELQKVIDTTKMSALKQVAQMRLARLLIAKKAYDRALAQLNIISDQSYQSAIDELKGDIYTASGNYKKAFAAYQKASHQAQKEGFGNIFLEMKTNELAALTQARKDNNSKLLSKIA